MLVVSDAECAAAAAATAGQLALAALTTSSSISKLKLPRNGPLVLGTTPAIDGAAPLARREVGVVVVRLARSFRVGSHVALVGRKLGPVGERDLEHEDGGRDQRLVLHAAVEEAVQVTVP
eukprot:5438269-Prymnesium_polylepis.1